jgi:hypothetical protein
LIGGFTPCIAARLEDHMLRSFGAALLLVAGLAITTVPARALHVIVTHVDKNSDGSMTYHFVVKTDQDETLTPGESNATSDFVTIYNFYGLIDGSAKSPTGGSSRPSSSVERPHGMDIRWYCRWMSRERLT